MRRPICLLACVVTAASFSWAELHVLNDVPSYIWHHGCGPTAAGMIMGYWDGLGFDDLIPGSNDWDGNRQAIQNMIASPGHVRDYVPAPDRTATAQDPYHQDDCLADFIGTSRDPLAYGSSYESLQHVGMKAYAAFRGYESVTGGHVYFGGLWNRMVAEIDSGRPLELFADSNADGRADHFVTAIGYDDDVAGRRYAAYNTHDHLVHWYRFSPPTRGLAYGVRSGTWLRLASQPGDATRDGLVNDDDLSLLLSRWGTDGGWAGGDFNENRIVDDDDLSVLLGHWTGAIAPALGGWRPPEPAEADLASDCCPRVSAGPLASQAPLGPGSTTGGFGVVAPEPSVIVLLLGPAVLVWTRRRRRR